MTTTETRVEPDAIKSAAGTLVGHAAGYVGYRTIEMGLRQGLFDDLAERRDPVTADDLAADRGLDPLYTRVWLRSALAAGVLDLIDGGYVLDPAMQIALLDADHGAHSGPLFGVLHQPELFDIFDQRLASGERLWWDECSPEFIDAVSATGRPFYNRLVPGALGQVPGVAETCAEGARVLELATGSGHGLARLAAHYPNCELVGVDGDEFSLERAAETVRTAGVDDRVELVESTFEDFHRTDEFDLAIINISMHECRDLEKVTQNVFDALRPGGVFVISDFPFPDDHDAAALRTPPGRVMSGIQFFEALIDDQLLPTARFVELLEQAGFDDVGAFDVNPVHAISHGRRPA